MAKMAFVEGFELGSSMTELATLSENPWQVSQYVGNNSTISLAASTMGNAGRSLQMQIYPSSTTSSLYPSIGAVTTIPFSTMAIGTQFSLGWRGRINTSKGANIGWSILSNPAVSIVAGLQMASATPSGSTYNFYFGTGVVGSVAIPDVNPHYFTMCAQKVATNVWNVQFYIDITRVLNLSSVSASLPDNMIYYPHFGNGGTTTVQGNIFAEMDDIYIDTTAPLGDINVLRLTPNADVQAQWTRFGTGVTTNYGAVNKVTNDDTTGVFGVAGNADLYSVSDVMPAGRRLYATKGTVAGYGQGTDLVQANVKIGSTLVNGTATAQSPFGSVSSTGWDNSVVGLNVASLQFGMTKTA